MAWRPRADGPDLSHYQHITDENAVPSYDFASTKISEGKGYFDPTSPAWLALFARRKIRRKGVYHWQRSDSTVQQQLDNLFGRCRQVNAEVGGKLLPGYMIQLDWETTPGIRPLTVDEVEAFCKGVWARYGDRLIVYGSDWVPGFVEWRKRNPTVPLWYANYRLVEDNIGALAESIKFAAIVTQWTSKHKGGGIASGKPGQPTTDTGYDMNHGWDLAALDRLCALTVPEPIPVPTPIPVPIPVPEPTPAPVPIPIPEDEMIQIVTNGEKRDGNEPYTYKWKVLLDENSNPPVHKLAWCSAMEHAMSGYAVGTPLNNAQLDLALADPWKPKATQQIAEAPAVKVTVPPLELKAIGDLQAGGKIVLSGTVAP